MSRAEETTLGDDITLGELARAVIRIERKLDMRLEDHERRLRTLERYMWTAMAAGGAGAASGIGALLSSGVIG